MRTESYINIIAIGIGLLIGLTAGVLIVEKRHEHRSPEKTGKKIARQLDRKVDLSREQRQQIAAIIAQSLNRHRELSPLHEVWQQDTLEAAALQEALKARHNKEAKAARRAEHRALHAAALADIHAILSPEQRAAALPLLMRHLSHGKGRHGKHGKQCRG